jgi:hypothetical protein
MMADDVFANIDFNYDSEDVGAEDMKNYVRDVAESAAAEAAATKNNNKRNKERGSTRN